MGGCNSSIPAVAPQYLLLANRCLGKYRNSILADASGLHCHRYYSERRTSDTSASAPLIAGVTVHGSWSDALCRPAHGGLNSTLESVTTKATYHGALLAESEDVVVVEGNAYFLPDSIRREYLRPSTTHSECPWKGTASYYDVVVNGVENKDAAWYYPSASDAAKSIEGRIAFWRGVEVG